MRDRPIDWPSPAPTSPPGWPGAPAGWHPPVAGWGPPRGQHPYPPGMFPAVPARPPAPSRPTYREPHPVRRGAVALGALATALWLLLTGLIGQDLRGYALSTLLCGALAWAVAILLARVGDRGVATGIALAMSAGWSITTVALATHWAATGDWPLW
ncbi:hypothetical protein O7621_03240 [Solwaraspora sp. WMMD937]|uniref:hypothetical protein n=1 Tax=Solwaraspora sp. WMMD937 TaxID=3016090 RepID=UPI00249AF5A1|nr:hypothetical protein [Solwaraspora sp. WMMD937]WFE22380.1 hypothetical protein O7621_03240 [Solwaraspora sp. WMMD937]